MFFLALFQEYKEYCHNQTYECHHVVPLQGLSLEHYSDHQGKYGKRNYLLDHFELHEVEGPAITVESDAVGWYLCYVFKECYAPGEQYYGYERPTGRNLHLLKFQVAIPCKCHEQVRGYKEQYCPDRFHRLKF